jgi:uncharacterized protein YjlB
MLGSPTFSTPNIYTHVITNICANDITNICAHDIINIYAFNIFAYNIAHYHTHCHPHLQPNSPMPNLQTQRGRYRLLSCPQLGL